ncbi:MAG: RidA family protein [Bacteroidetes bacterium]|nr:RidA family protein [Bacteroidota bacterium]MCH8942906.1 RidA family protein [Bacteroidota bacterium]
MSTNRQNISSNAKWEDMFGYSRAVKIGNLIEVSGTASVDGGKVIGANDVYAQTKFIIKKIETALIEAGAKLTDVIRTRIYIIDISNQNEVGRAHAEYFSEIKPATSMVEVKALVLPGLLVEIEATAFLQN